MRDLEWCFVLLYQSRCIHTRRGTMFYIHLHEPNFKIEKKQAARTGRLLFYG